MIDASTGETVSYASAADKIRDYLISQKTDKLAPAYLEKLKTTAGIEILDVNLKAASKYEQQFQQLTDSVQDSSLFKTYSRDYASDFDKVWKSVINVLNKQADIIATSDPQSGV